MMNTYKKYNLDIGLILIYLLPPVGIGVFLINGWIELVQSFKNKQVKWNSVSIFFLLLVVATIGSSIVMHSPNNLLISLMILGYWGIYLLANKSFSLVLFRRIKTISIYGGVYSVLSGFLKTILTKNFIIGFFTGSVYLGSQSHDTPRLIGNAYNPNFTAFLLLMSFIFLLTDIIYKTASSRIIVISARIGLSVILVWGIYETASRSIIICMFVLILILVIRLNKKIGYFLALLSIVLYPEFLQLIPRTENLKRATAIRTEIWNISMKVWEKNPIFGTTPFGFAKEYTKIASEMAHIQPIFYTTIAHAHNIFLAFLTEYGIIGSLGFAFLLFGILLKVTTMLFSEQKKGEIYDLFYLFLFMILITGIGDHPLASPQLALPTIMFIGFWEKYFLQFFIKNTKKEITIFPVKITKKIESL